MNRKSWQRLRSSQVFVGSFALLILLGTAGLKLIPGLIAEGSLSWIDAFFTITSAVCVTGLIVVDTATAFTPAGQAWLLLFIQLGGLGVVTFATLIAYALGRKPSLRSEELSASGAELAPQIDVRGLIRDIVLFTVCIEGAGALLLYFQWIPRFGWLGAIWPALFHSVSAFCNAGFSIYSDNLMSYQSAPGTLLTIGALVVAGGLGFLTLQEIREHLWLTARRPPRFTLHSRLVLVTTASLLMFGWIMFAILEWNGVLGDLPVADRITNALFLSITPRTAGFNSMDYSKLSDAGNFLTILLMTVGGSPGSTAGGMKTTTFALILLLAWSRFRGQSHVTVANRSIPEQSIERAVGLVVFILVIMTGAIMILTVTEIGMKPRVERFFAFVFECTSAFNTVGLSMGITALLTPVAKLVLIVLMFVGRVGPASAAAALMLETSRSSRFRYAYEDVIIG
jgi:trk system potassium uptake protein TrkH